VSQYDTYNTRRGKADEHVSILVKMLIWLGIGSLVVMLAMLVPMVMQYAGR